MTLSNDDDRDLKLQLKTAVNLLREVEDYLEPLDYRLAENRLAKGSALG
jgi:hypothetical protein